MPKIHLNFVLSLIIATVLPATSLASFTDVDSEHPNYEAINYVKQQRIVEGYKDNTYKPDQTINRAEFTKIVMEANFPGEAIVEDCFQDVKSTDWFSDYVCNAKFKNIVAGYEDGTFKPAQNINFVEAAKIINQAFGTVAQESDPWYLQYVEYLASLNAIPETILSLDQNLTRGEMAEIIFRLQNNRTDKPSQSLDKLQ